MGGLKVAVFGATGRIGGRIIKNMLNSNGALVPYAMVRKEEQVAQLKKEVGCESSLTPLVDFSIAEIARDIKGCDAVVFSAGAGGSSLENTVQIDFDGAIKIVDACKLANIKRFVIVSAIKAQDREFWDVIPGFKNYYICKNAADQYIMASDLDYTILQPGWFQDGKGTGKLWNKDDLEKSASEQWPISMDDVALSVTEALLHPESTTRKVISLANGDTPVADIFKTY